MNRSESNESDHSNVNHVPNIDELSNEEEEKQFEIELGDIDTIQQLQAEMNVPPGVAETIQQTSIKPTRFVFLSKLL